jgi:hypothetical protein
MSKASVAEDIRRLANTYKSMVEAADAIEQIGSIEQAVSEAKAARKAAEDERDSVLVDLRKAKDGVKKAKDDAEKIVADARSFAEDVAVAARVSAEQVKQSAAEQGQALINSAKAERETILLSITGQAAIHQAKLDVLKEQAAKAEASTALLMTAAEAAQAKLDKVQASIRKLAEV